MSYWPPLFVDGDRLELSHLEPFQFETFPLGFDQHATINVRFHNHCFTETFDPKKHSTPIKIKNVASFEARAFSPIRYELSKSLPKIIKSLEGQRIVSTREGNLIKIELTDGLIYPIFFTLRRKSALYADLYVVSAYPWDRKGKPVTTGEMRFNLVLAKILRSQPVKFPK